jgi:hypothetical protein
LNFGTQAAPEFHNLFLVIPQPNHAIDILELSNMVSDRFIVLIAAIQPIALFHAGIKWETKFQHLDEEVLQRPNRLTGTNFPVEESACLTFQ